MRVCVGGFETLVQSSFELLPNSRSHCAAYSWFYPFFLSALFFFSVSFFLSVQHCLLFSVVYATGSWGAEERGSLVMGPTFGVSMPCSWTVTNTETQVQAAIPIRILLCTFIHLYNLSIINVSIYFNIHNDQ